MFDDFCTQVQSDEFAWRYEEELTYETEARETRQENFQKKSRRATTVYDFQKTRFHRGES